MLFLNQIIKLFWASHPLLLSSLPIPSLLRFHLGGGAPQDTPSLQNGSYRPGSDFPSPVGGHVRFPRQTFLKQPKLKRWHAYTLTVKVILTARFLWPFTTYTHVRRPGVGVQDIQHELWYRYAPEPGQFVRRDFHPLDCSLAGCS